MPYTPLKSAPRVFDELRNEGFDKEIPTDQLYRKVMEVTGSIKPATIKNIIKAFEIIGYIELKPDQLSFTIKYWDKDDKKQF
jgi:hypothetical protein